MEPLVAQRPATLQWKHSAGGSAEGPDERLNARRRDQLFLYVPSSKLSKQEQVVISVG